MNTESSAPEVKSPDTKQQVRSSPAPPSKSPGGDTSGATQGAQSGEKATSGGVNTDSKGPNGTGSASPSKPAQHTSSPDNKSTEPASEAPAQDDDTEMKEAPNADADANEAFTKETGAETNGSPATKAGSNGKRKSSTGVPEHKSKKLNKKKSMSKITHLDAKPGDYFFARLKSYPPWPSVICDEEMLPQTLLNTRPVTTMKKDGTYNEAYADGGKKVGERTYPVMFLYTNEFAWIPNTDLNTLNPEECKDASEKGKSKSLFAAYQVAAEDHDLQYFKDMLMDHAKALQEDEEMREAKQAEKEAKAAEKAAKADKAEKPKKKRKSETKAQSDVEMEDAESDAEVKKSSKKRKKAAESDDDEAEKPAKTPKTTKLKLTTNKTPTTTEKKPKEKATKPKSEKKKGKAATSDEDMADAPVEEEEQPLDPVEARKAREKEVLFLRHKLQKGFLSRDQMPQEDEMPQMSNFIKKLENYGDLEVSIIRNTKINKVLKALVKLNTIPKDEEFNFRKRSVELLGKWNKILGAEPAEGDAGADKDKTSTPTTNGVHEDKTEDKKSEEKSTEKPAETSEAAKPESKETTQEDTSKQASVEDATPSTEPPKTDKPNTDNPVTEKAPESAAAAAEANEVVKAAE